MSIKDFVNMFNKKKEEAAQRRAEQSRKTDELETIFDETVQEYYEHLEDITDPKRKRNG